MPGAPTFLPTKSSALTMATSALDHGAERLLVLVGEAGAGDGDVIEAAVDRLQQHRHGGAAEGDGVRLHGRRQLRIERHDLELDVEPALLEQALVHGDEARREVGRGRVADHDLGRLRRSAGGEQSASSARPASR